MLKNNKPLPYIIAEIGINHEGSISKAIKLIYSAKKAGADAVKFQLFEPKTLAAENTIKTKNQNKKIKKETLFQMWERVRLNQNQVLKLKQVSDKIKIDFFCSVFDHKSLEIINKLKIKSIKIASSDITDLPLLEKVSKTKKKVFLSTGMASKKEILAAKNILSNNQLTILHCVSLYPCPYKKANLNRMIKLKKIFKTRVGYSDHCEGTDASIAAITQGAEVIEKHFTYNKNAKGSDHEISADYSDLKKIVDFSKNHQKIFGNGKIEPSINEKKMRKYFRKSIYYNKNLKKNHKIVKSDLLVRRPAAEYQTKSFGKILNKILKKNVLRNTPVKKNDLN